MVPVQPTINIDRPIGMRRASIENNTGKAIRLEDASGRYSEFLKSTLDKKRKINFKKN